ncbi:MAG: hypothetical protein ACTSRE_08645 [Promethearchaeota archaeon]
MSSDEMRHKFIGFDNIVIFTIFRGKSTQYSATDNSVKKFIGHCNIYPYT